MDVSPDVKLILKEVLSEITPTEKERKKEGELIKETLTILNAVIQRTNPKIRPLMVGSIAKRTDLRSDKDFDIFIQFPRDTSRELLEEQGLLIGKNFFELVKSEPEISYAEHPYVKGRYHGFIIEIVPCYKLGAGRKRILSAVDRSPLHTKFVVGELEKDPSMRGEIRLLKRFMKANGLYGAHAAVEGFSGYLCELLVIGYGSFMEVLKAASGWGKHEHLSVGMKSGKKKFADAPLVFIDPVDGDRNVAAAVSVEKLARFVYLAQAFLDHGDREFFRDKKVEPMGRREFYNDIKHRGTELICVHFRAPKLVEDTLIPQLAKSLRALTHECERKGFRILKSGHWTDGKEVAFLMEFEVWELPRVMKKPGPFFDSKVADMGGFIESNRMKAMSKPYLEGDQWSVDVEREHRHADDLVRAYLKEPKGFGKNLRDVKRFDLKVNAQIGKIKNPDFWRFMSRFW